MSKVKLSQQQLNDLVNSIVDQEVIRCNKNGVEFQGLIQDEILRKVYERLGDDWEVI